MKPILALMLGVMMAGAPLSALSINEGTKKVMAEAEKVVNKIKPAELKKLIEDEEEIYLIDIREKEQKLHGEIFHLNLVQISRGYLEFQVEREIPNKDARIIIYCCTGKRSLLTVKTMMDMGYTNVTSLEGGIRGWVEAGMVLDTAYGEMVLKH